MRGLLDRLQSLGSGPVMALIIAAMGIIACIAFLIMRHASPEMGLLYGDLSPLEGAPIIEKLESLHIPYQLREGEGNIYVPKKDVPRLRMVLAESGLPSGGSVGYEIFDRSDLLGSTNFLQELNLTRALEGELARTIRSLEGIAAVRVHLTRPKQELFSRVNYTPTAAITLKMQGRHRLSNRQVEAIQHMAAASVTGLSVDKVTVVDQFGTLLGQRDQEPLSLTLQEQKAAIEGRLIKAIESILIPILGDNKAIAHVNVVLDRNRIQQQREFFDPDNAVVRSQQTSKEDQKQDGNNRTIVSAQSNTPQPPQPAPEASGTSSLQKVTETKNYEISKTVETHTREWGAIERLSVAVVMDNGEKKEIPKRQMDEILRLVKAAVGFDEKRGDSVEVAFMPFVKTPVPVDLEKAIISPWKGLINIGEIIGVSLGMIAMFWFIGRPLVLRLLEGSERTPSLVTAMAAGSSVTSELNPSLPSPYINESREEKKDLEESPLEIPLEHKSSIEAMPGIVSDIDAIKALLKQNPELSATVLRQWIKEPR